MNNLTTFNKNDFFKKLDEDYEKIKINYKLVLVSRFLCES